VPIYALDDLVPTIDDTAFVHPEAVVIGNVTIGAGSSIWPGAVLRGDNSAIVIGEASSVQDGAIIHTTAGLDTVIGNQVVLGHLAHLEGCTAEDRCLIGVGSVILHRAVIGVGATVGAGAVVTAGMIVTAGALAVGVPAVIKPDRSRADAIAHMADHYVANGARFRRGMRRIS
jgi:carbonic anhydrase/acetyltransferase-like protein (isoleucine patch superfamily)